ncbi:MAG: histidine kinase [Crocinitomicaceae bacterium]|nr:histidine kinase [Crocinitomicaceae bacterium]
MRNCLLTLILLLCSHFQNFAQIEFHYPFHNLNSKNGLPSSEVYSVRQDSKGIIWICSDGGVTRYDGHFMRSFTTEDGLTDNVVFDFFEDFKGRIWFLTYNSELCYFDGNKIIQYEHNSIIKKIRNSSFSSHKTLYIDDKESIYYSIHRAGFIIINSDGTWKKKTGQVNAIEFIHENGRVIPSIETIAKKRNPKFPVIVYKNGIAKHIAEVREFISRVKIVSGSNNQIAIFNNSLLEINSFRTIFKGKTINNAIQTNDTTIWISTVEGAIQLTKKDDEYIPYHTIFKDQSISSVNFDSNGGIWISSLMNGVYFNPDLSIEYATKNDGLESNDIRELFYCESGLYIGFNNKWQLIQNGQEKEISKNNLFRPTKFGILNDKIVIAGNSDVKIDSYKVQDNKILVRPFRSISIEGNKIYGAMDRIYSIEFKNDKFIQDTLINKISSANKQNFFSSVCYSQEGLIVGGSDGLYVLENNQLSPYFRNDNYNHLNVKQILNTVNWGIVVATYNRGLLMVKNGKVVKNWDFKNGLISNQIKCVYESKDGTLIIGTNYGINYIPATQNWVGRISTENGLLGGNINAINESEEFILLGTINGLYRINKLRLKEKGNYNSQKVVIESVNFNGQSLINVSNHMNYPYKAGLVQIRFRTLNYTNLSDKEYEYRLSPEDNWIKVYSPEITISRPTGNYSIEVRFKLGKGNWSKPTLLLTLDETIPLWANPLFYVAALAFVLISTIIFVRFIYKRREARLILDNKVMSLQQRIEHVRLNPHFIFNVLSSIHGFVLFDEKKKAEKYLLKFSSLMRKLLTKSKEDKISIKEELQLIKAYLELESIRFDNSILISFSGDVESELLIPTMVVQPIVENAVKHGIVNQKGKKFVDVSVRIHSDTAFIKICNSGIMSKEDAVKFEASNDIHAVGINHNRLENYRKILRNDKFGMKPVNNLSNNCTEISIHLPIFKKHEDINS